MNVDNDDFGILAVCAIRYCQGRQTYMPELVRGIVRRYISEVTDKDLQVMINDCESQYAFGDESIDKPRWIAWKDFLITEQERRKMAVNMYCYKIEGYLFTYSEGREMANVYVFKANRFIEDVCLPEALSHGEFADWCRTYFEKAEEKEQ